LLAWFRQNRPGENLLQAYDIYVPPPQLRRWEEHKPEASGAIMTREELRNLPTIHFEFSLTALVWFSQKIDTKEKLAKLRQSVRQNPRSKMSLAVFHLDPVKVVDQMPQMARDLRYLWDNREASYLTRTQVDFLHGFGSLFLSTDFVKEFFKPNPQELHGYNLAALYQDDVEMHYYRQDGKAQLSNVDYNLRPPAARIRAHLDGLNYARNRSRILAGVKLQPGYQIVLPSYLRPHPFEITYDHLSVLTLRNVAAYLSSLGDEIQDESSLQAWMKHEGVNPATYELSDKAMGKISTGQSEELGGIDLNGQKLDLQILRDQKGAVLPIESQPLVNLKIAGFIPIIISITPLGPAALPSRNSSNY
jgi:hypothetical protein